MPRRKIKGLYQITNSITLLRMPSSVMLRHVALVRTDVSEVLSASIIRVRRIGELRITLAVTSNRCTLQRNIRLFLEFRAQLDIVSSWKLPETESFSDHICGLVVRVPDCRPSGSGFDSQRYRII
jgi:hypothetical protein